MVLNLLSKKGFRDHLVAKEAGATVIVSQKGAYSRFGYIVTHISIILIFVGALIGASLWILRPFLGAAIWAVTIVAATWSILWRTVVSSSKKGSAVGS